jgi:hypothetical protein
MFIESNSLGITYFDLIMYLSEQNDALSAKGLEQKLPFFIFPT